MKWFKHLSGSLKDSIIFESIEKFGGDGYLVFFGILEMMADEFDIYQPDKVTLSIKKMTNLLQLSRQKTVRILSFFDEKAKKYSRENKSFFAEVGETHVTIICNRFASLADNHTTHELKKASKLLRSNFEVTSPQDIKKEDNTDKEDKKEEENTLIPRGENIITEGSENVPGDEKPKDPPEHKSKQPEKQQPLSIYTQMFDIFWTVYPARNGKKLEKGETFRRYCLIPESDLELCNKAATNYADSEMIRKGFGIKDPKRFLMDGKGNEYWKEWIEPEGGKSSGNSRQGSRRNIEPGESDPFANLGTDC